MHRAGVPGDLIQQITSRLRRQLASISSAREELWLHNIEITSINHENVQKIRRHTVEAAQLDEDNDQRDVTRRNYRDMCEVEAEYFALRQQAWQEDVDALRLRAHQCFADPAWNLVNERLRENRDEVEYELETIGE